MAIVLRAPNCMRPVVLNSVCASESLGEIFKNTSTWIPHPETSSLPALELHLGISYPIPSVFFFTIILVVCLFISVFECFWIHGFRNRAFGAISEDLGGCVTSGVGAELQVAGSYLFVAVSLLIGRGWGGQWELTGEVKVYQKKEQQGLWSREYTQVTMWPSSVQKTCSIASQTCKWSFILLGFQIPRFIILHSCHQSEPSSYYFSLLSCCPFLPLPQVPSSQWSICSQKYRHRGNDILIFLCTGDRRTLASHPGNSQVSLSRTV